MNSMGAIPTAMRELHGQSWASMTGRGLSGRSSGRSAICRSTARQKNSIANDIWRRCRSLPPEKAPAEIESAGIRICWEFSYLQLDLNVGSSLRREACSELWNCNAAPSLAQQLINAEQLPTPPPQSASVAQKAVPQLHRQVLRWAASTGRTVAGTTKVLFSERSGIR